ncbi:hypothetical protein TNCT_432011 [Trichonephila clavata]|uniref:F-box domain-containing protein n=1 Tax=Trichonephila clavata TaxID=2740835 RepID=A0A8X6FXJ1_TRICU|nr:hypothetical protein TNCT_432011 [Trichonephila clavata]
MAFNGIGISSLPEEVLINIFKFLNIRNKLTASLVCKKWLRAINCHELLCDIKVHFLRELPDAFKCSRMTRQFEWFSFTSF